ncbi:hypothetical protein C8E83_3597 [Frondihabitans australicus]|uniref:Uncharacterized protein n=1 Tax=Frondihabitans australicus TaxID=386892 RepID=A0A495IK88_9MICO|nr:hypothetical protein C8E83_3597 [Frondihabitans australicus]
MTAVGFVGVLISTVQIFGLNLDLYTQCSDRPANNQCTDTGFYVSVALPLIGGLAAVLAGLILASRNFRKGRPGTWFSAGALVVLAALTGVSVLIVIRATAT